MRIRDQNADGVNFHKGITNSTVTQSMLRNTGDDGLAMWSDSNGTSIADANNSFTFNRVEIPVLANGIALYGGTNNSVTDNYVADQQAVCHGRMVTGQTWQSHPEFYRAVMECLASN
jgi:hypothetical protein